MCRTATTFSASGALDEHALREFLQRFVDADIGVYLASGGSGEGHALTFDEIRRIYAVGVEVCKGKVPVNANPPEHSTARITREHVLLAIESGVDAVNVYGPAGWHGYKPTDGEYLAYFDTVLKSLRHEVALAPNPTMGYTPKAAVIAQICRKYPQVTAINLKGVSDGYLIELREHLSRDVPLYVELTGSLNTLALGAAGLLVAEANILPKTYRRYVDLYAAGNFEELARVYVELKRFGRYVSQWNPSNPRWIKMAMRAFRLPGGAGGVREPYCMPEPSEIAKFVDGLLRLRLPEIDEMARAAGLSIPGAAAA